MIWVHLQTIFSFRAYHRLLLTSRLQRVGFALYLVILSFLVFQGAIYSHLQRNLPVFLKNFPQVTFEQGQLTAPNHLVYAPLPQSDLKIAFDATRPTPPTQDELVQNNLLMLVTKHTVYIPGASGLQTHPLPPTLSITTSPEFLARYQSQIAVSLSIAALMVSLLLIPMALVFDFCIAACVGLFFNIITRKNLARRVIFCWAFFLLGPLSVLWYVRLWYPIPLFTLAQIILCIIYIQQIFNLIPEEKPC